YCCKVFDLLTIAALIDGQIFCVHGAGQDPPHQARPGNSHKGAFCDLVWSDPENISSWAMSPRGAGWLFGKSVADEFMEHNNLKLICRAHQLVQEGKGNGEE
ncbi:Serine/threonine-protein phosphatase, partial [Caligus rogercresseyi]